MTNEKRKRSEKAGLPPGTLMHIGQRKTETVRISVTEYDEDSFAEKEAPNIEACFPLKEGSTITWISIDGIHDVEVIEKLGTALNLHPLLLEDILNTEQRPKLEDYGDYLYIVLKIVSFTRSPADVKTEQVSIILGPRFVLSLQEQPTGLYTPIQERLRTAKGRIRKMGADFLAYTLIDTIVDNCFLALEGLGDTMEELEENLVTSPNMKILQTIHRLKREMVQMRRFVWPLREVVNSLQRGESPLVRETTCVYLRDVYDHVVQIIDTIEALRDIISGMIDIYLSSISNRMNEIMKVLTIIATIFIPLTFVAGVFGMNFKYMPELDWPYGYPLCLFLMCAIAVYMVLYFRKKRWL